MVSGVPRNEQQAHIRTTLTPQSLAYLSSDTSPTHPDDIWALKWTSANQVISGAADGHMRVYDAANPSSAVFDLSTHPLAISKLSVSADGRYALGSSLDGGIVLVDTKEGRAMGKLDSSREKVGGSSEIPAFACALNPASSAYAYCGRSSKIVVAAISSETLESASAENGHEAGESESLGKGPLGGEAKVVDTGKGKFAMDINFSPDGRQIALSTENGHITVVDAESSSVVATYQSHAMAVRTISWSHDSQWLFSGSDDHRIVLHDIRAGSKTGAGGKGEGAVAILQGHQGWVLSVAAGPDGRLLGSAGADKQVRLWDIAQRSSVFSTTTAAPVWAFDWQPENVTSGSLGVGKMFATAGDEKKITIYRAAGSV